jgi:hypothetical protein
MGKIKEGAAGDFVGKVGNIYGSTWRGINYIKSRPNNFRDAKSEKQINQRTRFAACSSLARYLDSTMIKDIWNKQAKKMTGRNLFIKKNITAFGKDGKIEDFSKIQTSIGNRFSVKDFEVEQSKLNPSSLIIKWTDYDDLKKYNSDDRVILAIVFFNGDDYTCLCNTVNELRKDCETVLDIGFIPDNRTLHLYLTFADNKFEEYSESMYKEFIFEEAEYKEHCLFEEKFAL